MVTLWDDPPRPTPNPWAETNQSAETGTVYDRANALAATFGCRVAIVRNDCDGPGRHWEAICESQAGGFPSAGPNLIADIVEPPQRHA